MSSLCLDQVRMCSAVSLRPQVGQFLSGHSWPEYFPTWTLVLQNPVCCFDHHILYMSNLDAMARSRCSQSTSLNRSCGHFLVSVNSFRASSLLAWKQTGWDTSFVILFPQMTMEMTSRGSIWVRMLVYSVLMALWTAPFAFVLHTQLSCWISDSWCQRKYLSMCPAMCWCLKRPMKFFFVERKLWWMSEHLALELIRLRYFELNISARNFFASQRCLPAWDLVELRKCQWK